MSTTPTLTINAVIERVLSQLISQRERAPGKMKLLAENDILLILSYMTRIFGQEPMLLRVNAPVKICGDVHGQFYDLLRLLEVGGYPPLCQYLFLGDYVDRGKHSIESIILLFALKLRYPNHVYLLRGNHEDENLNKVYGFYDECKRKYNLKLWKQFVNCFNFMPIAALVNNKIFCAHGGISPDLQIVSQINSIKRPLSIPEAGVMTDVLWSDPEKDGFKGWGINDRGISYIFGADIVEKWCQNNNLDLIVRAHQVVEDGYEFFADKKLVTIFSAPNYDSEFTNSAAILVVDGNLMCRFHVLDPVVKKKV